MDQQPENNVWLVWWTLLLLYFKLTSFFTCAIITSDTRGRHLMMNIIMGHYELHAQTTYNCILSREDSISTYQASSILFPASFFFFFWCRIFFFPHSNWGSVDRRLFYWIDCKALKVTCDTGLCKQNWIYFITSLFLSSGVNSVHISSLGQWTSVSSLFLCKTPCWKKLRWIFNYPPVCWDEPFLPFLEGKRASRRWKCLISFCTHQEIKSFVERRGGRGGLGSVWLLPQINAVFLSKADNETFLQAHVIRRRWVSPHLTHCGALSAAAQSESPRRHFVLWHRAQCVPRLLQWYASVKV